MKFEDLKVGMKVRLRTKAEATKGCVYMNDLMEPFAGEVVTISGFFEWEAFRIKESQIPWAWDVANIKEVTNEKA